MKRTNRLTKLACSTETVRSISAQDLTIVAGGQPRTNATLSCQGTCDSCNIGCYYKTAACH